MQSLTLNKCSTNESSNDSSRRRSPRPTDEVFPGTRAVGGGAGLSLNRESLQPVTKAQGQDPAARQAGWSWAAASAGPRSG